MSAPVLRDKVALLTGGSRGIGFAIAKAYLQAGCRLVICGRDKKRLRTTELSLQKSAKAPGNVLAVPCDVTQLSAVEGMVEQALQRFGRIDILVNNAATSMTYGRVGDINPQDWKGVIESNLVGPFYCCHAVLPHMRDAGGGKIINLSGYGAGMPSPRLSAYGASKAGIAAFTRSLARECRGTGITVNLLSPGVVKTDLSLKQGATVEGQPFLKKGRALIELLAGPPEAAGVLAVKMASDKSRVTGKTFRVMSRKQVALRLARFALREVFLRHIPGD